MRRSIITIVGATAALSLTACGLAPEQESAAPPSSSRAEVTPEPWTEEATPAEVTPDEVPEPSGAASRVGGLGDTVTGGVGPHAALRWPPLPWPPPGRGPTAWSSASETRSRGRTAPRP